MAQYNTLNVKLRNSYFKKLKFAIKNRTEVTFNLSLNLIRNSNDETNFLYKILQYTSANLNTQGANIFVRINECSN